MGKIIEFRGLRTSFKNRSRHTVQIRVLDEWDIEKTRWKAQRPVQNAGGFTALRGFSDASARIGRWHSFSVSSHLIGRFARQIRSLSERDLVEVKIDGEKLAFVKKRIA